MGKFRYNAGGAMPSQFGTVPAGKYTLVIIKCEDGFTKNNDPKVNLELQIDAGPRTGSKIWHNVNFLNPESKGAGIALHFLHTIGQPYEGDFEVDTDSWIGKRFDADVSAETDTVTGKTYNRVKAVYPASDGVTMSGRITRPVTNDEERVPF